MFLKNSFLILLGLLLTTLSNSVYSFNIGEKVTLYVNKVGPYFNTHETYHYYQLPVCRPQK
ncbi:Transmembrane 9 superfamily member 1, partial [Stegodyphus mimosarum]